MEKEIINTQKLPADVQKLFTPFLRSMINIHDDNLISVFLTGESIGKNYIPKESKITSVFVFKELPFATLKNSLKAINEGIRKNIAAPLFLTKKHIETSLDIFPVEFLEMQENHILVYGKNVLSSLKIDDTHLRLFCEEQIKGKLIRIRQAYLEVGLKNKGIEALLKEALYSLLPIFRNLLRLKGKNPPVAHEDICNQLCIAFDLDDHALLPILKDTANDEKIDGQDVVVFLEKFIDQLNKLAIEVDQL